MKQNVLIISFNNFGLSFWRNHIELSETNVWLIQASGYTNINFRELNPSVVIIDSYFHKEDNEEPIVDLLRTVKMQMKGTAVFHFSPDYSGAINNNYPMLDVHKTVICKEAFWDINHVLNSNYFNDLTA